MQELRSLRKAKGLTMKQLGAIVGVSETAIHHYEVGDREPPINVLVRLADALDVSLDRLIRGKEKEPPTSVRERLARSTASEFINLTPEERKIALAVLAALQSLQE